MGLIRPRERHGNSVLWPPRMWMGLGVGDSTWRMIEGDIETTKEYEVS